MARKRFIAILLTLVMLLQLLPTVALSEEGGAAPEGYMSAESNVSEGATYYHVYFKDPNVGDSEIVAHQLVEQNTNLTVFPEDRTAPTGRKFAGWYVDDQKVEPPYTIIGETTIVAKYVPVETIDVQIRYFYKNGDAVIEKDLISPVHYSYSADDATSYTIDCPASIEVTGTTIGKDDMVKAVLYPVQQSVTFTPSAMEGSGATLDSASNTWTFTMYYMEANAQYTVEYYVDNPDASADGTVVFATEPFFTETRHAVLGNKIYFTAPDASVFDSNLTAKAIYEHSTFDHADDLTLNNASGDVLKVYYLLNPVTLTYDSQEGSYVEPKSVKYGQDVVVYTHTDASSELACGIKEEHTHTGYGREIAWSRENQGKTIGCYTSTERETWYGSTWEWVLSCGKEAHTHNASCYTNTPESYGPAPTREGYTFGGWYEDANCTKEAPAQYAPLTDDKIVYAKWVPSTANYTVVYMKEKWAATGNYYVYDSSATKTGTVGQTVTGSYDNSYDYYEHGHLGEGAVLTADGQTVVYVYYDLKEYTLEFDLDNGRYSMTIGGQTYTSGWNATKYTIKCVLGQDVSEQWPTSGHFSQGNNFYYWTPEGSSDMFTTKRFEVTESMLNGPNDTTVTYTAHYQSNLSTYYVKYWLEQADGLYAVEDRYSQWFNTSAGLQGKDLSGYTKLNTLPSGRTERTNETIDGKYTRVYNFYYTRASYNIEYYYHDSNLRTERNIKYESDLDHYGWTPTPENAGLDSDYTFLGWYEDVEGLGNKFDFATETMPGNNLVLYAKFQPPVYTVDTNKHAADASEDGDSTQQVEKGQKVKDLPTPTRPDYEFAGWYKDEACTEPYDLNAPVEGDMTLFAKWTQKTLSYTVYYVENGTGDVADFKNIEGHPPVTTQVVGAKLDDPESLNVTCIAPYIEGYRFAGESETVTINLANKRDVYFVYAKRDQVQYTIVCIDDSKKTQMGETITAYADAYTDRVTATAPSFDGYYLVGEAVKSRDISGDASQNVIEFHYLPYKYVNVQVKHEYYVEGNPEPVYTETGDVEQKAIGDSVSFEYKKDKGLQFTGYAKPYQNYYVAKTEDVGNGVIELVAKYDLLHWYVEYQFVGEAPEGVTPPAQETYWHLAESGPQILQYPQSVPGWEFDGWYTDKDCTNKTTTVGDPFWTGTDTVTVYGKWKRTTVDITVTKEWEGVPEGKSHPTSVQATITGGESDVDVTLDANNKWTDTRMLNAANSAGKLIAYGVKETPVNGYTTEIAKSEDGHTFTITNTYTGGDPVELTGSKTWKMAGNASKTAGVDLVVKRIAKGVEEETVPGSEYNVNWSGNDFTITGLKQYAPNGEAYSYTVSEAGVENGQVEIGDTTYKVSQSGNDITNTDQTPSWTVKKTVEIGKAEGNTMTGKAEVGDTLTYTVTVTNTGYVPLTKTLKDVFTVDGASANEKLNWNGDNPTTEFTLSRHGETQTFTATYTVQATDNTLVNTATVGDESDTEKTTVEDKDAWTVEKSVAITKAEGNTADGAEVGDTLTYTVTVKNTGNTELTGLTLTDEFIVNDTAKENALTWTEGNPAEAFDLPQGDTKTFTATYEVQPTDANLSNTATVDGVSSNVKTGVEKKPGLTAVKTLTNLDEASGTITGAHGSTSNAFKANETAKFTITVTNSGNTTQENVTVAELLDGAEFIKGESYRYTVGDNGQAVIAEMAPGQSVVVYAKYTVTQGDIDNETELANVATATSGELKTETERVPIPTEAREEKYEVTKTLASGVPTDEEGNEIGFGAGVTVEFSVEVKNTGNATLHGVVVNETMEGATFSEGAGYTVSEGGKTATVTEIPVGGSVTLKATYTVTQDDIDNQTPLQNIVTSDGDPDIPPVDIPTEEKNESYDVTKSLASEVPTDEEGEQIGFGAGAKVEFSVKVENTGNATLHGVVVNETMEGATFSAGTGYTVSEDGKTATVTQIPVGESVTLTATYKVTQDDIDKQTELQNIVTSEGDPDIPPVDIPTEKKNEAYDVRKSLKTAVPKDEEGNEIGFGANTTVEFSITVENTGNATLHNVVVKETLGTFKAQDGVTLRDADKTATIDEIKVGETATLTATYTVTQDDIDNETKLTNIVTSDGDPDIPQVDIPTEDKNEAYDVRKSLKTEVPEGGFGAKAEVEFTIEVENTGNATLQDVVVEETLGTFKAQDGVTLSEDGKTATIGEIAVGQTVTLTATYTVTQDDIDNQTPLQNIVTSEGDPDIPPVDIPTEEKNEAHEVTKTLASTVPTDEKGNEIGFGAGDEVKFTITVENTGNATLHDVVVKETLGTFEAQDGVTLSEDGKTATIGEIEVGETATLTATYTVTQDDIDSKTKLENTVTSEGDPDIPPVEIPKEDQEPGLTVYKTVEEINGKPNNSSEPVVKPGDVITYHIRVKNTGNVTLHDITAIDELTGNEGDKKLIIEPEVLQPGEESHIQEVTYTVTEEDILQKPKENFSKTEVRNFATAIGYDPNEEAVSNEGSIGVDCEKPNGHLTITKETISKPAEGSTYALGEKIEYKITAKNDGNLTLTNVVVTDQLTGDSWTVGTMARDAIVTFTASHVVTEDDILAGSVVNVATATGTSPDEENPNVPVDDGTTTDPTDPKNGHLTITKKTTSTPKEGGTYALGETITYEITATNDGNLTLTGITVTDELTGNTGENAWTIESLEPGKSKTFTASHVVTEDDILAGSVKNVATATGTSPDPNEPDVPVDPGDTEDKTDPKNGHLTITKTTTSEPANGSTYALGETITYSITATNDGNLTLTDITVTDKLTGESWKIESLEPGATSEAFTTSYTVTEADILAGKVVNEATAEGTSPDPETPPTIVPGTEDDPTQTQQPSLFVEKKADKTSGAALGEEITYTITVTNNGNVTVSDITVTDPLTGLEQSVGTLAPGASAEAITTTYTVTEADILAGEFVNTAIATGTDPDGGKVTKDGTATVDTAAKNGELTVEKTVSAENDPVTLGDTITYTITVTNSGNVTVSDITVRDPLTGLEQSVGTLAPGESAEAITTTYTVTETDILTGEIVNVATATGTDPDGDPVTGTGSETVTDEPDPDEPDKPVLDTPTPALTVTKEVESNYEGHPYALGETIRYRVTVTNSGNVTLKDVVVVDDKLVPEANPNFGGAVLNVSVEPGTGYHYDGNDLVLEEMAPNATYVIEYSHQVTEEDILAGEVENTATATGTDPDSNEVTGYASATANTAEENGHLTINKTTTSTPANGEAYVLGETITYSITATNDGNLTLTDITVTDELTGDEWTIESLEPGASESFTAEYVVTEADVLAGSVVNVATATGTSPDPEEPEVPVEPGEKEDPTEPKNGHLTITKTTTSTPANGETYALGETITYEITATNDGNLTITDVAVTDELTGDKWTIESLAPGASETFTAEYVVTEADIKAGSVKNVAAATGTSPDPEEPDVPVEPGEKEDKTDPKNGHLTITKTTTSTPANGETYALGETITYSITATNDGNLTLTNVIVTDELTGDEWTIASLEPGANKTFTAEHVVTEADIRAGKVVNVAAAEGTSPDPDKPEVPVDPGEKEDPTDPTNAELTVVKTASGESPAKLGDTITYTITVKNDGNVTVSGITVTDPKTGMNETIESLEPGAQQKFTTTYTVSEADILAGEIVNVATAAGTDPDGKEVTGSGTETVTNEGDPTDPDDPDKPVIEEKNGHLTITKTTTSTPADGKAYVLGETITYEITAENDGNLTLTNVVVTDELTGNEWPIASLAPGKSETFTTSHVVTEDDILAGSVVNEATASGTSPEPADPPTVIPGTTTDPTDPKNGHLTITKTTTSTPANGETYALGETISYSITATNDGNLTLTDVVVTDELTGDSWTIESLAPEASRNFTASHVVTEADIRAGSVVNVATATGKSPDPEKPDVPVVPGREEDDPEPRRSGLTTTKTLTNGGSGENGAFRAGETATFTITVTNTGNTTQRNVIVTEGLSGAVIIAGDGYTVSGNRAIIASINPGESVVVNATYTVTQADVNSNRAIYNTATVSGGEGTKTGPDPEPVPHEIPMPGLSSVKTLTNSGSGANGAFKAGETATFDIVVTNTGNTTQSRVVVNEMPGARIVAGTGYTVSGNSAIITNMIPGAIVTVQATYTVTQADIDSDAPLQNVATVSGGGSTNPDPEPIPEEEKNPGLTTTKTLTNAGTGANGAFKAGETANFDITVRNTGNTTQTNITVTEGMSDATIIPGTGYSINAQGQAVISSIAPGAAVVVRATYTITQEDIDTQREIVNTATVSGGTGETIDPDPVPVPEEQPNPGLTSVKALTNAGTGANGAFRAGETAQFTITVTNTGNTTQENVVVRDTMTGATIVAGSGYTLNADGSATIAQLLPGESVAVLASYTITQADIDTNAQLANTATVDGEGDTPEPDPAPIPHETPNPVLTVDKTAPAGPYTAGDTITYTITVTNSGNVAVSNITVADPLTGMNQTIASLAPGASQTFTTTHRVTNAEVTAGRVANTATASGTAPNGDPVTGEDSVEVQALEMVQLNVRYWYDAIGGTTAAPTFVRHYFVGDTYSVTSPRLDGFTCNLPVVSGTIVRDTVLNVIYTGTDYTLTITYVYEDGTTAAPTVQQTVEAGSTYSVTSPSIAGYTPSYAVVSGTMPARNVNYTVIYVPNETEILIDEYGVPLNIGNVTMNVGDCFE